MRELDVIGLLIVLAMIIWVIGQGIQFVSHLVG